MIIGPVIYDVLSNASAITAIVSTKIYPVVVEQDIAPPYIQFSSSMTPTPVKLHVSPVDVYTTTINAIHKEYEIATYLAALIRSTMDLQVSGNIVNVSVDSIRLTSASEAYEPEQDLHIVSQVYTIRVKRDPLNTNIFNDYISALAVHAEIISGTTHTTTSDPPAFDLNTFNGLSDTDINKRIVLKLEGIDLVYSSTLTDPGYYSIDFNNSNFVFSEATDNELLYYRILNIT